MVVFYLGNKQPTIMRMLPWVQFNISSIDQLSLYYDQQQEALLLVNCDYLRKHVGLVSRQAELRAEGITLVATCRPEKENTCKNYICHSIKYRIHLPLTTHALIKLCHRIIHDDQLSVFDWQKISLMEIIGHSKPVKKLKKRIVQYAATDHPVLIVGESGTGKELVATAIHSLSERENKRLITVNCAAIPETIIESELFGSKRGSYTDAVDRKGFLAMADHGTLFLDEIGEFPLTAQAKLLRVLENKPLYRLGGREELRFNFRLISATNRTLDQKIKEKQFRLDLYYRINTLKIEVPSLNERVEDIPLLIDYFMVIFNAADMRISITALNKMVDLPWPGNIRQLANTIKRAICIAEKNMIREKDIDPS